MNETTNMNRAITVFELKLCLAVAMRALTEDIDVKEALAEGEDQFGVKADLIDIDLVGVFTTFGKHLIEQARK